MTVKRGTTYRFIVSNGFDSNGKRITHKKTWKPPEGLTPKQIEKAVQRAAMDFERSIEQGYSLDNKQTFAEYCRCIDPEKGIKIAARYSRTVFQNSDF